MREAANPTTNLGCSASVNLMFRLLLTLNFLCWLSAHVLAKFNDNIVEYRPNAGCSIRASADGSASRQAKQGEGAEMDQPAA